jgi:hypothetical protein
MAAETGGRLRVFIVAGRKEAKVGLRRCARQHRGLSTRFCSQFECGVGRSGRTALRSLFFGFWAIQLQISSAVRDRGLHIAPSSSSSLFHSVVEVFQYVISKEHARLDRGSFYYMENYTLQQSS